MEERNRFAPPAAVTETGGDSTRFGGTIAISAWAVLVAMQAIFSIWYSSFLFELARTGAISPLQFLAMSVATACFILGALSLLVRRKGKWLLLSALIFSMASLLLGVWYHMVTGAALSALGFLLALIRAKQDVVAQASLAPNPSTGTSR